MPLLEINDLIVLYGEIEALRGVSISVDEGRVVTLLGANGAGKSTTLRAISGLAKPAAGEIVFDGKSIAGLGPEAIVRLGISHVPEGRRIFPGLSVKENIMLGASNRRIAKSALSREADAMFDLFPDIRTFSNALGWTLSGMLKVHSGSPSRLSSCRRYSGSFRKSGATARSCWSSKTPAWDFRSPIMVTFWKPAASCWAANPTSCGATKPFAPLISAVTLEQALEVATDHGHCAGSKSDRLRCGSFGPCGILALNG